MDNSNVLLERLRNDDAFASLLGNRLRDIAAGAWSSDSVHPEVAPGYVDGRPGGQCYVSAMLTAHFLMFELGIDARVASGSLWSADNRELQIPFHGWVVVGDPLDDHFVIDITADQCETLPAVIVGTAAQLQQHGLVYHYQRVAALRDIGGSVIGRWLALHARANHELGMKEFREMAGLDLSHVTDRDVRLKLDADIERTTDTDGRFLLSACRLLADRYSFSQTRTYPRPDHADPSKRRSLGFLLTGILVSLRTTLENEQRAMAAVLDELQTDHDLYTVTAERLAGLIRPAGMPEKRAKTIIHALKYCRNNFGQDFKGLIDLPEGEQRQAVLEIPGFGPKSADCFLSIGLGVSAAVVDINVFRSYAHLSGLQHLANFGNPTQVEKVRTAIDSTIPADPFLRQIVHTLLLLFGKDRFGVDRSGVCLVGEGCKSCAPKLAIDNRLFT